MSLEVDPPENQINILGLLQEILYELKLLNARTEEAFETGIEGVDDE